MNRNHIVSTTWWCGLCSRTERATHLVVVRLSVVHGHTLTHNLSLRALQAVVLNSLHLRPQVDVTEQGRWIPWRHTPASIALLSPNEGRR